MKMCIKIRVFSFSPFSLSYAPFYPPRKAEGYRFVHVSPSIRPEPLLTAEQNFMKLVINMNHYNDVMHIKFGLAGLGSS